MKKIALVASFIWLFVSIDLFSTLVVYNSESFPRIDWVHYHYYEEIVTILLALNKTYSDIVDVFSIGKSCLNRDIYCVRLTNESDQEQKPEVLFVGYHHAREHITSESALYFVVHVATNFGANQTVTELLNGSEIYVVVALNVDGFDLFESNGYQRNNARNVDLNRNFDYAWDEGSGGGSAPFSEPETQAIRDLVLKHHFLYALSFHSGTEMILYPWESTADPPPDEARFIEISKGLSEVTGETLYEQGSLLYISYGTWDDWMYGVAGTLALTLEIFGTDSLPIGRPPTPYDDNTRRKGYPKDIEMKVSLRYMYNPFPKNIETVVLRWFPAFFYITNRAVNEAYPNAL